MTSDDPVVITGTARTAIGTYGGSLKSVDAHLLGAACIGAALSRAGWKLGGRKTIDGTLSLVTDPFGDYPMGVTAENVAERYRVSREDQDRFAAESQKRGAVALKESHFDEEIVDVDIGDGEMFRTDEHPRPNVTAE